MSPPQDFHPAVRDEIDTVDHVYRGSCMTPRAAVARLVELIDTDADFMEEDVYAAMAQAGVPASTADRAFKFTQIAFGRVFLDGMGIRFPPDYLCFNAAGDVIESGLLAEQPFFVAATTAWEFGSRLITCALTRLET